MSRFRVQSMEQRIYIILCIFLLSISCFSATVATDTLLQGEKLLDWEYLVSESGTFKLGFFSLGNSRNRYLGISYNNRLFDYGKREVWVANRNSPISDSSGILEIDPFGKMKISQTAGSPIMLSSTEAGTESNVSATLYDSGNFVLREMSFDGSESRILWQSFDYPTDTLLPGMKIGVDFRTGKTWSLNSWISYTNPAMGSFRLGLDPNGTKQLMIWWREKLFWTSGLWQKGHFEFAPDLPFDQKIKFSYASNENEKYFMFSVNRNSSLPRYVIDLYGNLEENYGAVLMCSAESSPSEHENEFGCVKDIFPERCKGKDFWYERKKVQVYDFLSEGYKFNDSKKMSIFDCQSACSANCSCTAYASANTDGTGCKIWSKLSFSKYYHDTNEEVYFLETTKVKWWIWLIVSIAGVVVFLTAFSLYYFIRRKHKIAGETDTELEMLLYELGAPTSLSAKPGKGRERNKSEELQFVSYESIVTATNSFSAANKLGEGGFGPVFRGKLHDNQEVAIKRLSRNSGQGVIEFKNEAMLIAKLQHKNLVRIIGCCIQKEEKMLIYEYMPNKSLDFFLFDSERKRMLDWKKRLDIIDGIVQGLLYLHKYSRLRIVHRDLKASNILLDAEMNPKISDFGMARIVGPDECQANTKRVVGTYGYMSPEYAMEGIFSTKSDVYSFGVLLLEIVSGRKNSSFYDSDDPINLIGYALEVWTEGRSLELVDPILVDGSGVRNGQMERCVHVGLLCVEENPVDRPSMEDVMSMLCNESYRLRPIKQPAFHKGTKLLQEYQLAECMPENCSLNKMSISDMDAR